MKRFLFPLHRVLVYRCSQADLEKAKLVALDAELSQLRHQLDTLNQSFQIELRIVLPNPQARAELSRYRRHRISRIVWTEVLAGETLERRDVVRQAIGPFDVVEIDARIAMAAADIRHRTKMKLMDAYILASAQVNGAILITRNTKDFPAEMPGIRVPYTL